MRSCCSPLDVSDPQNLYQLRLKPWTSGKLLTTSYPAFEDYRQRNTTFSGMAGFNGYSQARLSWGERGEEVSPAMRSPAIISICWACSRRWGGSFHAADEHGPNSAPYMVLSDSSVAKRISRRSGRSRNDRAAQQRSLYGDRRGPGAIPRHGAICVAGLLDPHGELLRARITWQDRTGMTFNSDWPAEARRDAPAGDGKSECDRGRSWQRSIRRPTRNAAAADSSRTLRRTTVTSFADFFIA